MMKNNKVNPANPFIWNIFGAIMNKYLDVILNMQTGLWKHLTHVYDIDTLIMKAKTGLELIPRPIPTHDFTKKEIF